MGKADLADVIWLVQCLRASSENTAFFNEAIQQVISAMRIAANIQAAISSPSKYSHYGEPSNPDTLYLISSIGSTNLIFYDETIYPMRCCFKSCDLTPPVPPPRIV